MGDKRQKMISLDLTSYEYASQKTNFSKWVREKLMEEYNKGQQTLPGLEKEWLYCPECYHSTNSSLGYCLQCVPKTVKMVSHADLISLENVDRTRPVDFILDARTTDFILETNEK